MKYGGKRLNILDAEIKVLTLKEPIQLGPRGLRKLSFISSSYSSLHNGELLLYSLKGKAVFLNSWTLAFLIHFMMLCFLFDSHLLFLLDDAYWIDVCPSNGNLLVSGGGYNILKIFDKRQSNVVKTLNNIHSGKLLLMSIIVI